MKRTYGKEIIGYLGWSFHKLIIGIYIGFIEVCALVSGSIYY